MMWGVIRSRTCSLSSLVQQWKRTFTINAVNQNNILELQEIEKILTDVKADDVKVIPVPKHCDWADFMVLATGRSTWHAKQKQKGAQRMLLPSVQGQAGGKWIVVDSGKVIVHALDEKARAYYNLEGLWTPETLQKDPIDEDLEKAMVKVRRINNSKKKPAQKNA
ncbi:putative protein Iojap/ribosomal silencing factor RsfS [Lupinus albus]|uniref:Uncharacterized protein n=1 Tax=Lupinus albus TaxID=3870 RepID=A0A6A4PTK5_LUPAL|nr:putative protein Iojap/ribosomal silencing factor RsfS [Lupinus albus]